MTGEYVTIGQTPIELKDNVYTCADVVTGVALNSYYTWLTFVFRKFGKETMTSKELLTFVEELSSEPEKTFYHFLISEMKGADMIVFGQKGDAPGMGDTVTRCPDFDKIEIKVKSTKR